MKQPKALIRKRVIKIVNSRLRVEVIDGYLCEKDLQTELGATTRDLQAILSMIEKYFNIAFDDVEEDEIFSVNSLINQIEKKMKPELQKMLVEYS